MKKLLLLLIISPIIVFSQQNNMSYSDHMMIIESERKVQDNMSFTYYYNSALEFVRNDGESSYDAIVYFYRAIEIAPNNLVGGVYSDLANCFRGGLKNYTIAEQYYSQAILNDFSRSFVYYNRAICRYMNGNLEESKIDLMISKRKGWNHDYFNLTNLLE